MGSLHQLQSPARAPAPADLGSEATELALVERARGGDVDAWARLYQDHFDRVFRYIAYLTGDTQVAEDFVQETFARAYVSLSSFEGRAPLTGWLRGIAINIVRRHWRSRSRGDRAMDRLELMSRDPAVTADADPEGAHLRQRRAADGLGREHGAGDGPAVEREGQVRRAAAGAAAAAARAAAGPGAGRLRAAAADEAERHRGRQGQSEDRAKPHAGELHGAD